MCGGEKMKDIYFCVCDSLLLSYPVVYIAQKQKKLTIYFYPKKWMFPSSIQQFGHTEMAISFLLPKTENHIINYVVFLSQKNPPTKSITYAYL